MKKIFVAICALIIALSAYSQAETYQSILDDLLAKTELKNASLGIYAENLTTGEVIMNHNSMLSLVPASVFKIIPTSMALELFGPEHTFKTEIAYSGSISADGTLNGNIYIVGYGDPCLGSDFFSNHYNSNGQMLNRWALEVKKLGIKKITGDVIGDISYFGEIHNLDTWIWEDLANYYGNPGSSLNYHDNLYYIHFSTGNTDGSPTTIKSVEPENLNLNFNNEVTSSSTTWDESYIFFGKGKNDRDIRGTLPWKKSEFSIKGSIVEPELLIGQDLIQELKNEGISISGTSKREYFKDEKQSRKIIYTQESPNLLAIAEKTNLKSFNLYAEVLSHHVAKELDQDYPSAVKSFWAARGIDTDGLNIEDACGLSHFNSITAQQMTEILKYLRQKGTYGDEFYSTLPVAGTSGTLSRYCIGAKAQNRLHAKSGSMTRVRAYGGYILNASGEEIAFCFISNNYNCNNYGMRKIFENFFNLMAGI